MSHFYCPVPRVREGQLLGGLAGACIDISDGLLADLGHICTASGVGARLDLEQLPLAAPLQKLAAADQARAWALSGGDDYELCFTVAEAHQIALAALIDAGDLHATEIGTIVAEPGLVCHLAGEPVTVSKQGYQHFE